jgi:hypothetical protein
VSEYERIPPKHSPKRTFVGLPVHKKGDPGKDGTEAEQTGKNGERTDQD